MKMFVILARCVLIMFCLPRRCDGCLDTLLRSFFQVFNPTVEAGPNRLLSRHPYADGIMPDYPVVDGGRVRNRRTGRNDEPSAAAVDYDNDCGANGDGPTADYVDRGDCGCGCGPTRGRSSGAKTAVDGDRLRKDTTGRDDYGLQPLTDFIASLIETVQLTSRATLKKSRLAEAAATTTATTATSSALRRPRAVA